VTSKLDGGEWLASRPDRFTPREGAPGTHWVGGWMGPRAGLDSVSKRRILSPYWESNSHHPIVQPVVSCVCFEMASLFIWFTTSLKIGGLLALFTDFFISLLSLPPPQKKKNSRVERYLQICHDHLVSDPYLFTFNDRLLIPLAF
jgi:hypothetical protein